VASVRISQVNIAFTARFRAEHHIVAIPLGEGVISLSITTNDEKLELFR
jgi:hypothetical protein